MTAAILVLGSAGCGGSDNEIGDSGTSSTSSSSGTATPSTDTESDDTAPVLDHEEALAAGFDHTAAITCGYTYDEQELAGLKALSPTGEVPPEATIYLDRGAIFWEIPEPDGRTSHILALDGYLYTWKVPGDSDGVKSRDTTNGGGDELKERMSQNAHDCVVYGGPSSIFQPPKDITFQSLG
ncbi:hypothetical protein [Antricoccus suffuscus]|uniref:hypothetical protein n=1 Tax=Antricoccus suffuscus TaxID=1629062 RepID=UPI0011B23A2B|nr:hypothetical protein [Antricoccus suffuscus]